MTFTIRTEGAEYVVVDDDTEVARHRTAHSAVVDVEDRNVAAAEASAPRTKWEVPAEVVGAARVRLLDETMNGLRMFLTFTSRRDPSRPALEREAALLDRVLEAAEDASGGPVVVSVTARERGLLEQLAVDRAAFVARIEAGREDAPAPVVASGDAEDD